jgi:hypothetical protein
MKVGFFNIPDLFSVFSQLAIGHLQDGKYPEKSTQTLRWIELLDLVLPV